MANSYTTLKGFDSITDVDMQNMLQQNVISFFDWGFIDKGGFTNVRLSKTDIRGSNKSILKPVQDPNYTDGQIWSTFRENLVWESGVSCVTQPIAISGVWVNGVLKTPTASGYHHYVDYINGRVVFDTAIATNSTVAMEYSYKNINVTNLNIVPLINDLQLYSYDLTNPNYASSSGDLSVLGRAKVQTPIVCVEMPKATFRPLEFGSTSQWMDHDILFHVLSEDNQMASRIATFISAQKDKTIYLYDLNMMARSGVIPLDYRNTPISGAMTYPYIINSYKFNKLYFEDVTLSGPQHVGTVYHSTIRFTTETITV